MGETFKDSSRKTWASNNTIEHINAGSLQRIADATEKMAQRHTDLMRERDQYKGWYEEERQRRVSKERSNHSLRGQITKLRKRLAAQTNNSEGA